MNLSEFKAWLDGFSAGMGDAPTPEQWKAIKAKIAGIQALTFPSRPPDINAQRYFGATTGDYHHRSRSWQVNAE